MKKKILLILFLGFTVIVFSQKQYNDVIVSRKKITITKDSTLIITENINPDLSFLCNKNYIDKRIFSTYNYSVFQNSRKINNQYLQLKQWNTPIIIFFDKQISKIMINKFKLYFDQLKGVKNLKISYTKNLEKANYYFKVTRKKVSAFDKNHKFSKNFNKKTHPLFNLNYNILTDKNNKFYSCILEINQQELEENDLVLKKMKQLFYLSLGNFTIKNYGLDYSLISIKYRNDETISKHDLDFLKIHYGKIYEQKINENLFNELKKIANEKCNNK